MPDRRTFLITCAASIAGPALAHFDLPPTASGSVVAAVQSAEPPRLRIDGWDSQGDSVSDVWVQISSSWRANWR